MAALPYMPLFVADYLADTAHLTPAQHGAYLLLIMNYWQRGGPLPNDDARLARIARMNKRDWSHNRDDILEFFTVQDSLLYHSRIDSELSRVEAKSLKCKDAAKASVQRRFGKRSTDVEPTDTHTEEDNSEAIASGGEPPADPVKQVFDLGVSILASDGTPEKQARSLIGKWCKGGKEAEVLQALLMARSKANPIEWLSARFKGARYVSASGYEYRGDEQEVMRQAEKRADWGTYWKAKANVERHVA